jgi:hypothetical protein
MCLGMTTANAQFNGDPIVTDVFGFSCHASQLLRLFGDANADSACPQSIVSGRVVTGHNPVSFQPYVDGRLMERAIWEIYWGHPNPMFPSTYSAQGDPEVGYINGRSGVTPATAASGLSGVTDAHSFTEINSAAEYHRDVSQYLQLGGTQKLVVGGYFQYQNQRLLYDAPAGALGQSIRDDKYSGGGWFLFEMGQLYVNGMAAGNAGYGSISETTGAFGTFGMNGWGSQVGVGHVFSLWGSSPAPAALPFKAKAPVRPVVDTSVKLDLSISVGYDEQNANPFTDSMGLGFGTERERSGYVAGRAAIYASLPGGNLVYTPNVTLQVLQGFAYSHTLDVPAQAAAGPDTIFYGSGGLTMGEIRAGLDIGNTVSQTHVGISSFYRRSSDAELSGVTVYFKAPLSMLANLVGPH